MKVYMTCDRHVISQYTTSFAVRPAPPCHIQMFVNQKLKTVNSNLQTGLQLVYRLKHTYPNPQFDLTGHSWAMCLCK